MPLRPKPENHPCRLANELRHGVKKPESVATAQSANRPSDASLVATLADLLIGLEDTVHRSDGTEICALIQQFRIGFGRCLVGERLTVEDVQNAVPFVATQCPRRRRPWLGGRSSLGLSVPVDRRPRHADGVARDGCPHGGREFLDRFHGSLT